MRQDEYLWSKGLTLCHMTKAQTGLKQKHLQRTILTRPEQWNLFMKCTENIMRNDENVQFQYFPFLKIFFLQP